MTTAAGRRVTYQLETLWDYDYQPTHDELTTLYETAKKNQWNGSAAIDWNRPVGTEGPVLNVPRSAGRSRSACPPGASRNSCTASRAPWSCADSS